MNYKKEINELLKNAYSPYSNIKVAAILIDDQGNSWKGVNIENAAYPSGICAERAAIFSAISNGASPKHFKGIYITSSLDKILYPCGGCRQVLSEHLDKDSFVWLVNGNEEIKLTLDQIIPNQITKDSF